MKDTLYETVLSAQQIDAIHAGLIANAALYKGILKKLQAGDEKTQEWCTAEGFTIEHIERVLHTADQMKAQFDHFILGTPLPTDEDKTLSVFFKEAYDPFEQH